jgi:ABC-type branched-subunit amino acid transport system ATPase component
MKQGTIVHQAKYTKDLMKKFNMNELEVVSTLMNTATLLNLDENGEAVDQREYRSMIDSLLYLMVTRLNI